MKHEFNRSMKYEKGPYSGQISYIDIFKIFDIENKGYLNIGDLNKGILRAIDDQANHSYADDIYLIYKRYDKD